MIEVTDGGVGACTDRFDETTNPITALSTITNIYQVAADDHFYCFATNSLWRLPR